MIEGSTFCDASNLPHNVDELREIIVSLRQDYESQIRLLHEQIRHLRSKLFGRKTEKYVEGAAEQLSLFDEIEDDLPRVEVIHDLAEEDKVCACGNQLSRIGEEISEMACTFLQSYKSFAISVTNTPAGLVRALTSLDAYASL